jgi:hypothetical protein
MYLFSGPWFQAREQMIQKGTSHVIQAHMWTFKKEGILSGDRFFGMGAPYFYSGS